MQRENNKEERRKQQEALRQEERDQDYSNKVYLSPLANEEGTYTEALNAYEKAVSERVFYEKKGVSVPGLRQMHRCFDRISPVGANVSSIWRKHPAVHILHGGNVH